MRNSILHRFGRDERGVAVILVSIMLPAIIGFALLVIDMSRATNLHNDLQKAADAFAIASAAELDGKPDAWTRAERALANLLQNSRHFSEDAIILSGSGPVAAPCATGTHINWCFLKDIPANDSDPITNANYAADFSDTHFIQIEINPTGFSSIFPASFLGGTNSFSFGAEAVAGFGSAVCEFTPFYICNPYEGTGVSIQDVVNDPSLRGRMIELRQQGGAVAQNSPGNYGFLQPSDGSTGADAIRDMIASVESNSCYAARGVQVQPGFLATVRDALNVRFDVYDGPMNSVKNNASFAPASNVRKGYRPGVGNACNASEEMEAEPDDTANGYQRMSRDTCFYDSSCDASTGLSTGNRIGDGLWDFENYWAENRFDLTGVATLVGRDGVNAASNANPPTRYDLYRYEIANAALLSQSSAGDGGGVEGEAGAPACSSETAPADIDRRLVYGAIINCQENPIGSGASGDPVPAEAFGSFFLTETVESGPDQIIRIELVDVSGGGLGTLNNFVRDEVQLYR